MGYEKIVTLAERCAKYAQACGKRSILETKAVSKSSVNGLKYVPTSMKDSVQTTKSVFEACEQNLTHSATKMQYTSGVSDVVEANKIFMNEKGISYGRFCDKNKLQQKGIEYIEFSNGNSYDTSYFNYLKGHSGKKGNFEIHSFFNFKGKQIGSIAVYKDKGIRIITTIKDYKDDGIRLVSKKTYSLDGKLLETSNRRFIKKKDNAWLSAEEIIQPDNPENTHIIQKLEAGKKKQQIEYNFNYDEDMYANIPITENMPERFREFLPLYVLESSENLEGMIKYIGRMEENNLGISGLVSKDIKIENLSDPFKPGNCNINGVITLNSGCLSFKSIDHKPLYRNETIFNTISHETKHRYDFSDLYRTEESIQERASMEPDVMKKIEEVYPGLTEFVTKSQKRGVIPRNDSRTVFLQKIDQELVNYNELCKTIGHDNLECEKSAIKYAKSETDLFKDFFDNLFKYLNFI